MISSLLPRFLRSRKNIEFCRYFISRLSKFEREKERENERRKTYIYRHTKCECSLQARKDGREGYEDEGEGRGERGKRWKGSPSSTFQPHTAGKAIDRENLPGNPSHPLSYRIPSVLSLSLSSTRCPYRAHSFYDSPPKNSRFFFTTVSDSRLFLFLPFSPRTVTFAQDEKERETKNEG